MPDVVVLNGGSSSGKSTLAAGLQAGLPEPWLSIGVDTFIGCLPGRMTGAGDGIQFAADGQVSIGADFTRLEIAWMAGVAAMVKAGAKVIVDDSFLSGPAAQKRWRDALAGLDVLWIGVRCSKEVATAREARRRDRQAGMAARQADAVHEGIDYDAEIDTSELGPADAVARLRALLDRAGPAS